MKNESIKSWICPRVILLASKLGPGPRVAVAVAVGTCVAVGAVVPVGEGVIVMGATVDEATSVGVFVMSGLIAVGASSAGNTGGGKKVGFHIKVGVPRKIFPISAEAGVGEGVTGGGCAVAPGRVNHGISGVAVAVGVGVGVAVAVGEGVSVQNPVGVGVGVGVAVGRPSASKIGVGCSPSAPGEKVKKSSKIRIAEKALTFSTSGSSNIAALAAALFRPSTANSTSARTFKPQGSHVIVTSLNSINVIKSTMRDNLFRLNTRILLH